MQKQPTTANKPLTALREALYRIDSANDRVLDAERDLAKAKQQFSERLRALGPIWFQAFEAAQKMGEKVPDAFREGGLLIRIDDEGEARAERLPEAATASALFTLAEKAGEHGADADEERAKPTAAKNESDEPCPECDGRGSVPIDDCDGVAVRVCNTCHPDL